MEIFWRPKKLKKVPVRHGDPMENHEQCSHPWIRAGDISLQPKPFTNLIHILSDRIQHFRNNMKAIFKAAFTYRQNYHGVFRVLSDVLCKLPFSILPKAAWPQWPASPSDASSSPLPSLTDFRILKSQDFHHSSTDSRVRFSHKRQYQEQGKIVTLIFCQILQIFCKISAFSYKNRFLHKH